MAWSGVIVLAPVLVLRPGGPGPGPARWQWPLRPRPAVIRAFDPPAHPWERGHRGVDLAAASGTTTGRPVFAAGPGRVGFARDLAGRGVVTIVHGVLRTTYLPVRPSVRAGQTVAAGARIGVVDDVPGHCGPRDCLHWGLLRGDTYLDPLTLLGLGPVRLLPWWSPAQAAVPGPAGAPREAPGAAAVGPRRPPGRTGAYGDASHRGDAYGGWDGRSNGRGPADRPGERSRGVAWRTAATPGAGGTACTGLLALALLFASGRKRRRRRRPRRGGAAPVRPPPLRCSGSTARSGG